MVPHNFIDLTGQRFGRLIVVRKSGKNKHRKTLWECQCDCGGKTTTITSLLKNGNTKSCGCLRKEITKKRSTKHGLSKTSISWTWQHMIQRCTNPASKDYKDYGGRGITVCDRWLEFKNFHQDMGSKPNGTSIDRINNDLGYFKKNCRWATPEIQARNQRIKGNNQTGVNGVGWHKQHQKYQARIRNNGKDVHLGYFKTISEAAEARKLGEIKYWGKNYA